MFRGTRILAPALALAFVLISAPATGDASLRLEPGGADSGNCVSSPCATFAYAYGQSGNGDVIEVAAGVYGDQQVPYGTKAVTFHGAGGTVVRRLENNASNITFDAIEIDAGGTQPPTAAFENHADPGGRNVTFRNARIGNVVDQKGAVLGGPEGAPEPMNVVIDNVVFHDVVQRTDGVHNECIFSETPGLTIRNSTFVNCATMDLFILRGDWWGQQPYGDVTLENNVFGHSVNGDGWHYYGLYWSNDAFERIRVVNNTFENPVILDNVGPGPYSGVWANNLGGGWSCLAGVEYRNNIGRKCDGSDRATSPETSCAPPACSPRRTMPVGWVDPDAFDFHLQPRSIAVDAGAPVYAPARDRDGVARDARPDVGAYEYSVGGTSGPGGAGGAGGAGSTPISPSGQGDLGGPRLTAVTLRPRTICRHARRTCRGRAHLRVRVSRRARLTAQVLRSRRGRTPRRVLTFMRPARSRHVVTVGARSRRPGRYVVRVSATDAAGLRSATVMRRLRVR